METNKAASATKPYQCKHCPKTFVHKISYQQHVLNQHGKDKLKIKPLHCSECLKTKQVTKYFARRHLLKSHIREFHSQRRCECDICFKKFTFPSKLKKHRLIHLTDINTKFKCDLCSQVFGVQKTLKSHFFYKHGRKSEGVNYLTCDLCPQEFLVRSHLESHVLAKHVVDKDFECDICSKKFIDLKTLNQHVNQHDTPIKYLCDVCFKPFKSNTTLSVHLGVKHNKFFYCHKCSKSFTDKPEFDQHFNSKNGLDLKLEFKCPFCSKILPTQCTLNIHTNSHPNKPVIKTEKQANAPIKNRSEVNLPKTDDGVEAERPKPEIKCELCSKIFDRESYFATHRKQVHPNAEWSCDFENCTRSFKKYHKLRLHKMRHSSLKPFKCPTCHKSFSVPTLLTEHLKTHLDEKQFKCDMCPKTFVRRVAQRFHIANKHGGSKPFKCPITNCEMSFASNAYLNSHLVSHETVKSFKCNICIEPKEFKGLPHLKQHLRVVHSVGNTLFESKYADALVFTCTGKDCSFQAGNDKEVAVHYNEQHGLPKVQLFKNRNIKIENNIVVPLFSEDIPIFKAKKLIIRRYKCKFCLKLLGISRFELHQETCAVKAVFKCSDCSQMFRCKTNLSSHINRIHYKSN